jgi:tRNA threonylcarbamoyl adenosine modification protein (Sua5/YciO/YrdC/YwlC family)
MAERLELHPTTPQARILRRAADCLRNGGVVVYPTDSCYALGCAMREARGEAGALERLRALRGIDERHHLTLMCRDLSEIANYAVVDDASFRFLKIPGSYTFILRARREVPRRSTRKKTIGVRIPGHPVAHALLAELDEPMLSATLFLPGDSAPLSEAGEIRARLERRVDLVIDAGACGTEPSTLIDLTGAAPVVLRKGKGPLEPFAVEAV